MMPSLYPLHEYSGHWRRRTAVTKLTVVKSLSIALSIGVLTPACDGGSRSANPMSPTPSPQATYTISGVVAAMTATGPTPLIGAGVFINGHRGVTIEGGFYSIAGVEAIAFGNSVTVSKAGYGTETRSLMITGDTRADFQLVRTAVDSLSGVVSEITSTGRVPLGGVRVDVSSMPCDERGTGCLGFGFDIAIFQSVMTDKNGFYSVSGLYPGKNNSIWAAKAGFEDPYPPRPEAPEGGQALSIDGNTSFDILLVRR
jgi:hypothetical protein